MPSNVLSKLARGLSILAIATAGGMSVALAHDYGGPSGYEVSRAEEVVVPAPRYRVDHPHLNVPIENVSLSEPVSYADLNLRSRWGAHVLRTRIRFAASKVCRQLITMYPYGEGTSPQCYREAVAGAMGKANSAIDTARGY